jgi:hypothetical protein
MKKHYTYDIKIPPSLNLRESLIINKITNTLNDSRGWRKFSYRFDYVRDLNIKPDFIITIVPNRIIKKVCGFNGLSCADSSTNIVYLNLEKWKKGSSKSKLSLDDYRNYLILHECSHITGKGHIKLEDCKPGIKCPIMVQQTLGIGNLKPNCWPTKMDNDL